jgi:hypothetical protein
MKNQTGRTPEHTPLVTPERVPLNTGNQSGGEYNNSHGSTPNHAPAFDRGVVKQHSGNGKK